VEFCLLGPLVVRSDGTLLPIAQGKQRAVLAALLVRAGEVVPAYELTELIWEGAPPRSARVTLQNYVKRLRQALGDAGPTRIRTHGPGYLIDTRPGELDLHRFSVLCAAGRAAVAQGDWERAALQLRAALSLWRGQPFVDVSCPLLAARETPPLVELRMAALGDRIDADLHLGCHAQVIPELQQLAVAERRRERVHALLMRALYQAGRPADALAAYRTARQALVRELGLEPGTELRELHRRILAADPGRAGLAAAAGAGPGAEGVPAAPRQLPTAACPAARRAELRALTALLDDQAEADAAVLILVIGEAAGTGKTALAAGWARQVAERFPAASCTWTCAAATRRRCRPVRPSAGSWRRSRCPPGGSRPAWTPRPPCTAASWRGGGCWSYSTTPATVIRSARCCPAAPAAWSWSPAGTS
jgi:DNA-binding SARP family transcriptional activator